MRQKENIEQRISNAEAEKQTKNFIMRNSLFDIRYSLRAHGKFMIHELPTGEGLAKQLPIGFSKLRMPGMPRHTHEISYLESCNDRRASAICVQRLFLFSTGILL
jgi:hypothetical protein